MIKATVWAFAGVGGQQVCRFIVVIILARLLTPEAFGIVAGAQVILAFSEVLRNFGVGSALIQARNLTVGMERTGATIVLITTVVMCLLLIMIAEPLGSLMNIPELVDVLPLLLLAFLLRGLVGPSQMLLNRDMQFKKLAVIELGSYVIGYALVAVWLAYLGYSYWSLIIASVVQAFISSALIFMQRPVFPTFRVKRDDALSLLNFGGGMFLSQLINNVARRGDNVIVSAMLGPAALGFYSRGYAIMDVANGVFGTVFYKVLFPGFSKKQRKKSSLERRAEMFALAHAAAAFIMVPTSAIIFLLSEEIVWLVLGDKWGSVAPVLQILSLGMYFRLAYKVSGASIAASGAVYQGALRQLLYAVLVVLGALVGSRNGLVGVAYAVLFALIIHWLAMTYLASKLLSSSLIKPLKAITIFALSGAISLAATKLMLQLTIGYFDSYLIVATISIFFYASLYAAILFLARDYVYVKKLNDTFLSFIEYKKSPRVDG